MTHFCVAIARLYGKNASNPLPDSLNPAQLDDELQFAKHLTMRDRIKACFSFFPRLSRYLQAVKLSSEAVLTRIGFPLARIWVNFWEFICS